MNTTGRPAASTPAGYTNAGLPVGLQIVGRHLDDLMVLHASAALERAKLCARRRLPLLATETIG